MKKIIIVFIDAMAIINNVWIFIMYGYFYDLDVENISLSYTQLFDYSLLVEVFIMHQLRTRSSAG